MKDPYNVSKDIPMGTPLNPVVGMSEDLDTNNPFESEAMYAGDSVDEHVTLEQANQYFAEKEIKQVYDNS
ncbi:hypothetical protein PY093_09495 [Cytobacillus sp. S13-E01]|uniref:hypothetical protein n=1 Tax=Cytobacillus sp. S13-E01 TaxID=3031326 RepID=UPI0023D8040E|nr:hypothetical protein [Cytobacillus sp. S13-E01]MDF0726949.1 hypothetical protein [Cytobacillus sp. S13-E01]